MTSIEMAGRHSSNRPTYRGMPAPGELRGINRGEREHGAGASLTENVGAPGQSLVTDWSSTPLEYSHAKAVGHQ
jgi:hypothetical protein